MGFLWEVGPVWVYLFWILIFVLQMLVAEMHRRWTWTAFALWTVGGVLAIPYVIIKIFIKPAASSSFNERTGIMSAPSYVEVASVSE